MFLADAISILRLPLGVAFVFVAPNRAAALGIVAAAALTDVLDGWVARRAARAAGSAAPIPKATPADARTHGEWLDPLCDKLFVGAMLLGLYLSRQTPLVLLLLVVARELLQLLAMVVYSMGRGLRRFAPYSYRTKHVGKATTVLQFATAIAILFGWQAPWPLAIATALLGLISVAVYVGGVRTAADS